MIHRCLVPGWVIQHEGVPLSVHPTGAQRPERALMRRVSQSPAPQSYYDHRNVGQGLPRSDTAHVLKLSGVNDTSTLVRQAVVSSCGTLPRSTREIQHCSREYQRRGVEGVGLAESSVSSFWRSDTPHRTSSHASF